MKRAMSIRQRLYRKYRIEGMNKKAAALKAGYSYSTATTDTKKLDKNVNMDEWLQQAGLTDKALSVHAREGLEATKVVSAIIVGKDADEKTNDFIDVPDWSARHKYFETVCKLRGKLKNDPLVDLSKHEHLTIIVDSKAATEQGFDLHTQLPAEQVRPVQA